MVYRKIYVYIIDPIINFVQLQGKKKKTGELFKNNN